MADLEKLAEQILDEVNAHASSIEEAIRRETATPNQMRATLISVIERRLRELPREKPQPTGLAHRYRVWFDTYHYSLGFIVGTLPENAVNIEGLTKEGIIIEAYTVADVIEQAKFEIHALTYNLAGGPYQTVIRKIAPDVPQLEWKPDYQAEMIGRAADEVWAIGKKLEEEGKREQGREFKEVADHMHALRRRLVASPSPDVEFGSHG